MPGANAATSRDGILFAGNLAILEPEKWIGQPLPILEYLKTAEQADDRSQGSEQISNLRF